MIRQEILISLPAIAVTLGLTGILYPVLTPRVANVLFPARAQGSFVADERGKVVGSELIGQALPARRTFRLVLRPLARRDGTRRARAGPTWGRPPSSCGSGPRRTSIASCTTT